jgi:hypothetical protein
MGGISVIVRKSVATIALIDDFPLTISRRRPMYDGCFTLVTPCITDKNSIARIMRNSLVIVHRLSVIFRGTFVAHNPVFAMFGIFSCLCAGVSGSRKLTIFTDLRDEQSLMNCYKKLLKDHAQITNTDKNAQPNFMRDY